MLVTLISRNFSSTSFQVNLVPSFFIPTRTLAFSRFSIASNWLWSWCGCEIRTRSAGTMARGYDTIRCGSKTIRVPSLAVTWKYDCPNQRMVIFLPSASAGAAARVATRTVRTMRRIGRHSSGRIPRVMISVATHRIQAACGSRQLHGRFEADAQAALGELFDVQFGPFQVGNQERGPAGMVRFPHFVGGL